jgi:diguanylate cyclase (GGDEF)-like protein
MAAGRQKTEVFADFSAFLNALLPQALGFLFHDRKGRLFWRDRDDQPFELNDDFHAALAEVLGDGDIPGDEARIKLDRATAFVIPLTSDRGRNLGALTAVVDPDTGGMPYQFCVDVLSPAVRSLGRELSLRYYLMDVNKQLEAQTTDHDFLQALGDEARQRTSCQQVLGSVLELCLEHLKVIGATLVVPDKKLYFAIGDDPVNKTEAQLFFESLVDAEAESKAEAKAKAEAEGEADPEAEAEPDLDDLEAGFVPAASDELGDTYSTLIRQNAETPIGVLVLSHGGADPEYAARLSGLIGFVVSTIEHVIERDFDALTGLILWPNFEHQLDEACRDIENYYSLMFLDIDQLHVVNDTFGRAYGDIVLKEFAAILKKNLGEHLVTRVTSDSFAALLKNKSVKNAEKIAKKICTELNEKGYAEDGKSFRPSVSIGVAQLVPSNDGVRSALVPAQVACQAAKDRGRGRVEVYQSADTSIVQRLEDINQVGSIRNAIESGRLILYAQPIVSLRGGDLTHYFEILVRMLNTAGDPVEPAEFMSAAERYQLMQELDRWVVAASVDALLNSNHSSIRFAINLSGQSLGNDQFLDFVRSELQRSGLAPNRLSFEITETVAVANLQKAQLFMNVLKELGCHFSLDDFGTGLSSFAYLKLFPVNALKIDGSFVRDITENEVSKSMVAAIAEIARVMNLETVAEFVQDQKSMDLLKDLGVTWAQGYFIGTPRPLGDYLNEIDAEQLEEVSA